MWSPSLSKYIFCGLRTLLFLVMVWDERDEIKQGEWCRHGDIALGSS